MNDRPPPRTRPRRSCPRVMGRARRLLLAVASLPLFQTLLCYPDPIGALNFELQNFLNRIIFTVIDSLVRNLLRL